MIQLSEESLKKILTELRETVTPTRIFIPFRYIRRARLILQPWRGEPRRKYLNKRRRS